MLQRWQVALSSCLGSVLQTVDNISRSAGNLLARDSPLELLKDCR